jgi:hypothetical protein
LATGAGVWVFNVTVAATLSALSIGVLATSFSAVQPDNRPPAASAIHMYFILIPIIKGCLSSYLLSISNYVIGSRLKRHSNQIESVKSVTRYEGDKNPIKKAPWRALFNCIF